MSAVSNTPIIRCSCGKPEAWLGRCRVWWAGVIIIAYTTAVIWPIAFWFGVLR